MTSLTLVRRIGARPSVVFDALTAPEAIREWWGPDAGPVLIAETDPRVGGRFRVRFRMLDGSEHESSGEYLEVDPAATPDDELALADRWWGTMGSHAWRSVCARSKMARSSPSPMRALATRLHAMATRRVGPEPSTNSRRCSPAGEIGQSIRTLLRRPPDRQTRREMMNYVDHFVAAVPAANKDAYLAHARTALPLFK